MRLADPSLAALAAATGPGVSGMLLLDKPAGISSQAAVSRVKRLLGIRKAGHTGTLDPLATGLLPVCVGEATKFSHLLLASDKTYEAGIRLGVTTTTGDREGDVTSVSPVTVTVEEVESALRGFIGDIAQVPPMYSAIKHEGRRLYRLAREGISVPRAARTVTIHSIELQRHDREFLYLRIVCGKGTYIRVLAQDIGRAVGCDASLDTLRRCAVGDLSVSDAITLEALEGLPPEAQTSRLLRPDAPVAGLPRMEVEPAQAQQLVCGRSVRDTGDAFEPGMVRLYVRQTGQFLGVGTRDASGWVAPRRMMRSAPGPDNA